MIQNWKFQRGNIFFTRFDNATGSEQSGNRPAVVLQNDVGNFYSPTLIVATLTSKTAKKYTQPTHCLLVNDFLSVPSIVQAGSPALCRAERSRRTPVGGHQAARQGGGRRCSLQGVCRSHQPGGAVPQLRQHAAERLPYQLRGHGAEAVRPAGRRNLLRSPAAHRGGVGGQTGLLPGGCPAGRDVLCAAVSWAVQRRAACPCAERRPSHGDLPYQPG